MTKRKYELFLFYRYSTIAKRPEYAIRLANTGLWDAPTGYNNLLATITVK